MLRGPKGVEITPIADERGLPHDAVSVGTYKCWCPAVLTCLRDDAASSCIKCEAMGMLPSYEDVKNDFELYSQLLQPHGVISIHDTDSSFEKEHIVTADIRDGYHQEYAEGPSKLIKELKENKDWEVFNFFNNGILRNKPASTGLTFIQRCKN